MLNYGSMERSRRNVHYERRLSYGYGQQDNDTSSRRSYESSPRKVSTGSLERGKNYNHIRSFLERDYGGASDDKRNMQVNPRYQQYYGMKNNRSDGAVVKGESLGDVRDTEGYFTRTSYKQNMSKATDSLTGRVGKYCHPKPDSVKTDTTSRITGYTNQVDNPNRAHLFGYTKPDMNNSDSSRPIYDFAKHDLSKVDVSPNRSMMYLSGDNTRITNNLGSQEYVGDVGVRRLSQPSPGGNPPPYYQPPPPGKYTPTVHHHVCVQTTAVNNNHCLQFTFHVKLLWKTHFYK
jgi:hypothetical protein